jgi:hypothetical protein
MPWLRAAPLVIAAAAPLLTQEIHMTGFTYQLPNSWHVTTDGQYRLFASLSTKPDLSVLPVFMAWVCDGTENHGCAPGEPDLSSDKACAASPHVTAHQWPGGIKEKRWICPLLLDKPGVRYSSSLTYFEFGNRKPLVTYMATEGDKPPMEFLDDFVKTMRPQ